MRALASIMIVLALAAPAAAQDTFKQVWVTQSSSGEVVHGRIVDLSPESLTILTADNRRVDMPLDRVLRIEARGDSLKNGAVIGALVLGTVVALTCAEVSDSGGGCITAVALDAGMGALIGAGLDALNGGRSTLYARPASAPAGHAASVKFKLKF
jgi:hypothetical protein